MATATEVATRFDRRLIAPMLAGTVLNPINSSIIAVSLVPIGRAFGATTAQTAWLVSALYLATAIGQPVFGRLVDLFGPRRLLVAGGVLTTLAGLVGTTAPNLPTLVIARVILGFGTCAGYPASMYLIKSESRRNDRLNPAAVLTALSVSAQTTVVVGPSLGGGLIALGGWRWTFAINIPLGLLSLVLAARYLPSSPRTSSSVRLDLPGIALFAGTLVALLLFLMHPQTTQTYLVALAALAAAALTRHELRAREPFLDLRLLGGNVPLLATYARNLLAMTVTYAFLYGFTQWTEDSRGLSASQAGLLLIPMSLVAIGVSAATGRSPAIRGKLLVAATAQLFGSGLLLVLHGDAAVWLLILTAVAFGIPSGLSSLANQNAVYRQADEARLASSAGLLRTFTYLGAIVASAAGGVFFGRTASTAGLHHLAVLLVVSAALFLLLVLLDSSLKGPSSKGQRS